MPVEFINELENPPPPPPPPPAMPYAVTLMQYASAGAGSAAKEWPQKNYPDGRRELLTLDEIGVWRRVCWLEAALLTPPTGPAPELPYSAKLLSFGGLGVVRQHLVKIKPGNYGPTSCSRRTSWPCGSTCRRSKRSSRPSRSSAN